MCIKPDNRPEVEYRLVVVKRAGDLGRTARLRVLLREGQEATLKAWDWPSGRPTTAQAEDMASTLMDELIADLVTRYGFQGSLMG